jgi:asparagine synthase (glutamine-hydrolysing)
MSAIAAFHVRRGNADCDLIGGMLDASPHRGSERILESYGSVALGIARDPQWPRASLFRGDRFIAALAGRLDNSSHLRTALSFPAGSQHADQSDAAIVAAAFQKWGLAGISRLRGSFSGLLTDGVSLWAFRDQFGSRPLFFHQEGERFFLATEVKQILAGSRIPKEPDLEHLSGVLFGGVDFTTAYKGVSRIPKASVVRVAPKVSSLEVTKYWDPSSASVDTRRIDLETAIEGTRQALHTAVFRVLTGEDAILLSGGLDSPALAAFAAKATSGNGPVQAVTSIYPDFPTVDESQWTRMAAEHLSIPLHEFVADAGSLDDLEFWTRRLDGPVNVVSVSQAAEAYRVARALGARTVMTGEMAEMVFESRAYLLDHLFSRGQIRAAFGSMGGARRALRRYRWLTGELARIFAPPPWTAAYYRRHPRPLKGIPLWIDRNHLRASADMVDFDALPARERWAEMQVAWMVGPGVMFEADEICAASCGVESRRPFADVDLVEYVLTLPAEVKFPALRTKPLLRAAMRGLLPDALIDRKDKTLFNAFSEAKADYETLRQLLLAPSYQFAGVDYAYLATRLQEQSMPAWELRWARTLARLHAFLNQW